MELNQKVIKILESLDVPKWKEFSLVGKNLIAITLAGVPLPGFGSLSTLVDKADHFLKPDLKEAIEKLANVILELVPEIEKFPKLEEQIGALFIVLEQNQVLLKKLEKICEDFNKEVISEFKVYTDNSLQELVETTVKDMNVKIEAHNGGVNLLYKFSTKGGNVEFNSTGGSHQRIHQSTFEGKHGGVVSMDKLNISGPVSTFDNKTSSGVSFGKNGIIEF